MNFTLDPALASIVRPAVLWLEDATVVNRDARMDAPLAAAEAAVRISPPEETTAVRTMYKRVGLDPTKTRPSSEALLRLEMAAELPTPAEHISARRMLQLQLLTKRNAPAPAETWGEETFNEPVTFAQVTRLVSAPAMERMEQGSIGSDRYVRFERSNS